MSYSRNCKQIKINLKNTTMNAKINNYRKKVNAEIERLKISTITDIEKDKQIIDSIDFNCFNNEDTFSLDTKNRVFFTYSDHYRANSGHWQSVGHLSHPHTNMEDRGYITGCAVDLDGFIKLKNILLLIVMPNYIHMPQFRESKHKIKYLAAIEKIKQHYINECVSIVENRRNKAKLYIKQITKVNIAACIKNI